MSSSWANSTTENRTCLFSKQWSPESVIEWLVDWFIHALIYSTKNFYWKPSIMCLTLKYMSIWLSPDKLLGIQRSYILRKPGLSHFILSRKNCMQLALKNWLWRKKGTIFSLKTCNMCRIGILAHISSLLEDLTT